MNVSLCVVAFNEEKSLPRLLCDIGKQTYPHEKIEVVLVDGNSTDMTKNLMMEFAQRQKEKYYGIQVIDNPGRIQSCGWNMALVKFTTDVILRVDAHSHIPPDFIRKNVEKLEQGEMVSGGIRPALVEGNSAWKETLLMAEESMFGSSISSFRRTYKRKYVKSFFHGAYHREVIERAGGFREDLGRTEDNEFHYRIRKCGYRLCMSQDIISYQYIRPTLRKMCYQKYGNGYWVGLTFGVCPGCLSVYHFVPFAFIMGILMTSWLVFAQVFWPAYLMWGAYGILAVIMAMLAAYGKKKHLCQLLLPFLFLLLHISYGVGTFVGIVKMPFWRKDHLKCESVGYVRQQLQMQSKIN